MNEPSMADATRIVLDVLIKHEKSHQESIATGIQKIFSLLQSFDETTRNGVLEILLRAFKATESK